MNKKNVLITGGLGGIGFNICKYFIIKNFNLIIVDNLPINKFNKILSNNLIKKNNITIVYKKINLNKPIQIKKFFKTIKQKFSSIDVLINCAGIQHISTVDNFSEKMWEKVLSIN